MELRLERKPADGDTLPGELFIDGARYSQSLERTSRIIPLGRYQVDFTVSTRAANNTLWSPDPQHRLPLILVEHREGIRIHAANRADQLEGCVALGLRFNGPTLEQSRAAVGPFVERVRLAREANEEIWLDVINAPTPAEAPRIA
jgi:hypothetical protein